MAIDLIGWDIGGAHLKAVAMAGEQIINVLQKPGPLWLGLDHFHTALNAILGELKPVADCRHAEPVEEQNEQEHDAAKNDVRQVVGRQEALEDFELRLIELEDFNRFYSLRCG